MLQRVSGITFHLKPAGIQFQYSIWRLSNNNDNHGNMNAGLLYEETLVLKEEAEFLEVSKTRYVLIVMGEFLNNLILTDKSNRNYLTHILLANRLGDLYSDFYLLRTNC